MRHIAKQHPQIATKIGKQKATFTHVFLKLSDDNYVFLQRSIDKPEATGLIFVHKSGMKDFFGKEMVRYTDALNLLNEATCL